MSAPRSLRSRRGFTLLEASISSAILAVTLFTALTVTHAATRASNRSVVAASHDAAATRRLDLLRRVLARAGATTLTAVPQKSIYGGSLEAEPMLDGVVYDNLRFREPVGFQAGESLSHQRFSQQQVLRCRDLDVRRRALVDRHRSTDGLHERRVIGCLPLGHAVGPQQQFAVEALGRLREPDRFAGERCRDDWRLSVRDLYSVACG